MKVSWAAGVNG